MELHARESTEDRERATLYIRRSWLSAINGQGLPEADAEYKRIVELYGPERPNPDFLSYMTTRWGPGPAQYSKAELTGFLLAGTLVEELIRFVPEDVWNGPTVEALVDELQQAVTDRPMDFLDARQDMLHAPRPYQYGYLNAYAKLWGTPPADGSAVDWDQVWPALLNWIEALISPDDFWTEPNNARAERAMEPNRDWIPTLVVDFINAGTRNDDHAFDAVLLPLAGRLIDGAEPSQA